MSHFLARIGMLLALASAIAGCSAAASTPPTLVPIVPATTVPEASATATPGSTLVISPTAQPLATLDPNATFLLQANTTLAMLFSVVDGRLEPQWSQVQSVPKIINWQDANSPLTTTWNGISTISSTGAVSVTWGATGPEIKLNGKSDPYLFRPDGAEIVYERDGDIYSKAAQPDATEVRWTTGRSFSRVTGWVDADTVLAQYPDAQGSNAFIVRRDGQLIDIGVLNIESYSERPGQAISGLLLDPMGRTRFIAVSDGSFFAIGAEGLVQIGDLTPNRNRVIFGLRVLGWTDAEQALVLAYTPEGSTVTQLLALTDTGFRPIAAELPLPVNDPLVWTLVPRSNQIALIGGIDGQRGIYTTDVSSGIHKSVSPIQANRLIGVDLNWLVAVSTQGQTAITSLISLRDGTTRKLVDAAISSAAVGPDGQIWLMSQDRLWRYNPQTEAPPTEINTNRQLSQFPEAQFVWPPKVTTALISNITLIPTSATAKPVPIATPLATEQRFMTIATEDGFVAVRAQPSSQSREVLRLPAGTEVRCLGLVVGEELAGSNQWANCPAIGGYIFAPLIQVISTDDQTPQVLAAINVRLGDRAATVEVRDLCIQGELAVARVVVSRDADPGLIVVQRTGVAWEVVHYGPYPGGVAAWDQAIAACRER